MIFVLSPRFWESERDIIPLTFIFELLPIDLKPVMELPAEETPIDVWVVFIAVVFPMALLNSSMAWPTTFFILYDDPGRLV